MGVLYQLFDCNNNRCRKEFIGITEYINNNTGFMACPYCGCRNIKRIGKYTDLRECMDHSSYVRENGAIKQKR